MTCIAELPTSTSSIASHAETTLLGVSGQYEASWCQLTRFGSPGSLANRWLWRSTTVSPSRSATTSMMRLSVAMSQMPPQCLCQLTKS